MTRNAARNAHKESTPILEWVLGGIGVALIIRFIVFLAYEGLENDERPGAVTAAVTSVLQAGDRHIVTFDLRNAGSQTLSNVSVTARVFDGEKELERVETVIDYLPGRSHQEGGFYLQHDPRKFRIEIAPGGYQKP